MLATTMKAEPSTVDWPLDAIPQRWVEVLFEKMLFTYGAKFSDQWKGIDPVGLKKHWGMALFKYSREELTAGTEKLQTRDWPPTLPEFEKMCRPTVDVMVAYYEALAGLEARAKGLMGEWSEPAVYWAAVKLHGALTTQTYSTVKARWESTFASYRARKDLEKIPMPAPALPAPGKGELSKDRAKELLKSFNMDVPNKKKASKNWAKNILEKSLDPKNNIKPYQIREAEQALERTYEE